MTALKTFEPNTLGRDIVLGDMHGKLGLVQKVLTHLNYDPQVDRLFSVGDLVDRGEDNLGCLRLLRQGLNAVQSNHGEFMSHAYFGPNDSTLAMNWPSNGGMWAIDQWVEWHDFLHTNKHMSQEAAELAELAELQRELPVLITINHRNGKKYHIVHAELPYLRMYEPITDRQLSDPAKVQFMSDRKYDRYNLERCFLWLRDMFGSFHEADMSNEAVFKRRVAGMAHHSHINMREIFTDQLSHVISGHTPVHRPFTMVGQTNIDTGSYKEFKYKWAGVTALVLDDWTFWKARSEGVEQVQPMTMTFEDFESYGQNNDVQVLPGTGGVHHGSPTTGDEGRPDPSLGTDVDCEPRTQEG
jgi:hypothetical protein